MFFSEEKNQKTFIFCAFRTIRDLAGILRRRRKEASNAKNSLLSACFLYKNYLILVPQGTSDAGDYL
jgi:hypothetical protein